MSVIDRDLVVVTGSDAFSFLQSLVSQDLDGITDGEVRPSLLLTPQGKLDSAFRVVRVGDEVWLDLDAGYGAALASSLGRYKIRVQADIEDRSAGWAMVALRDGGAAPSVGTVIQVAGGSDVIGMGELLAPITDRGLSAAAYERQRIEAGEPRLGAELDDSVIPQEAGLEHAAVSFTKGCFLGQELVCRIDTRGHVNRFVRRLHHTGTVRPAVDDEIRDGDRVVGRVTSVTPDDGGPVVALGFVRREIEPPAAVTVTTADGPIRADIEAIHSADPIDP